MPTYVVESYLRRPDAAKVGADACRAETVGAHGVRYLRTTLMPNDETSFSLFEAPSASALEDAYRRAGIPFDRITEALHIEHNQGDDQ